ncbi:carbamate kinase [Aerococcaceae bacterium zg-ZJ1578]|uniref:carbamate kinase n=1 Tax=Aerococcaceae TaxID=186827 RepID=UPI0013BCE231|nr:MULTISPECIES: carbamate kinase [unclassified Facklamia]MBK0348566.1 carbamate kinase [Aerococcaceae bacterium zg-1578]NEW64697.1 carbamate kinase [Facklamia sp. 252]NEW68022.1 carbamate kinase [Facklamia sp. 253]QQD65040.1 carbamate kinase [Aerococcaceae bacterium zg-252]
MKKKVLVALGGNAILSDDPSAAAQIQAVEKTMDYLVELVKEGHQLIISHGNGPQVGNILLQQVAADSEKNPAMPLDTCVAMTQGSIGFWLQNAMKKKLTSLNIEKEVISVVTQVKVDKNDPAFTHLTKPIGPFYSEAEKIELEAKSNDKFIEDAGRGFRKVVASPKPVDIIEANVIKKLVNNDVITIAVGGGGIPVVEEEGQLVGVEAVIDKDFASAKLAELIDADVLLILTGVDNVYINFNKPNQQKLENITIKQAKEWIEEGQFAPGSMLPKIEAAIEFVENKADGVAVITSLTNVQNYFNGGSATVLSNK